MGMLFGGDDDEPKEERGLFSHWAEKNSSGASWSVESKTDPRWNGDGRCGRSLFSIDAACQQHIEEKRKELGKPPEDLSYGGMKD